MGAHESSRDHIEKSWIPGRILLIAITAFTLLVLVVGGIMLWVSAQQPPTTPVAPQ